MHESCVIKHGRVAKEVLRYLKGTKDIMLTFRQTNNLEFVGYSYSNFASCVDFCKSTYGYIFIHTKLMIVDPLTKGMLPKLFKDHVMQVGLSSILMFSLCFEKMFI